MNHPITLSLAVAALSLSFSGIAVADQSKPQAPVHVDANGAEELIRKGNVIILDVRTRWEFAEGQIAGAKNLDFQERDFEQKVATLDRGKSYLVHCASGGRSIGSLSIFQKLGFRSVYHLDGGMSAWLDAGKPMVK